MSLQVQELTKIYGTQRAVSNISFEAKPGEILGFLGPNGAGKSTTLKIACGYLPPTTGEVIVAGYPVTSQAQEVKKRIGYLPEHNPLPHEMYVKEYLRFAASLSGLKGSSASKRVAEVIEQTGLQREQHKRIGALSKGYRQRVGLSQALVHEPQVLVLDEPTTGFDPNQVAEIRGFIKQIAHDRTVVLSSHILPEVEAICERVVVINRGELKANSTLKQLAARTGAVAVKLEVKAPTNFAFLQALPGLTNIELLSENSARMSFETAQLQNDPRELLFNACVANHQVILMMDQQAVSLEKLFKELTQ